MEYQHILFKVRDNIAFITFNRPDAANGLDINIGRELMYAAIECNENPDIRAVILTGTGKMFSAGGDLRYFAGSGNQLPQAMKEMTTYCHAAASRFMRMNAPLITAVNGTAAGMGMSFALCGDIIIAAESASFTTAYTAAALSPDGGMTYLLPRMIGLARAKEMLLTNRRLTAQEALAWGLVNKVVPAAELMEEAETLARSFAQGPSLSYGSVKKLLNQTFAESLETQLEHESCGITEMTKTRDAQEGIAAFLARRKPHFGGS